MILQKIDKINSDAYVVDLLSDFDISLSFNIEDLIAYKGPNFFPDNPLLDELPLSHLLRDPHYLLFPKYIPPYGRTN